MHCDTGMQTCRRSSKIAVLDTIHGALIIARKMVESGLQAEAFEVYHHTPDLAEYDLIVSPVHLSPEIPVLIEARRQRKRMITHHQAVGELLMAEVSGMRVFEVTGTHSKTSSAILLSMILSRQERVLSHTTRGLEIWHGGKSRILQTGLSITPGNVIRAVQAAKADNATSLVCEISLGGTGLADFGILTSLSGDYLIADGTKWASTAKLQMISLSKRGATILANRDARISPDVSFADGGSIYAKPDSLVFPGEKVHLNLGADLDFWGYETAIAAAAAAADRADVARSDIAAALDGFDGLPGRMKIRRLEDRTVFDCSNSGLKVKDIARALDRAYGPNLVAVVGEDAKTVCEGLNIPALVDLLRSRRDEISRLILVGERLFPLAEDLRAATACNLQEGLETAESISPKRLLSCVKCFR